MLRKREGRESTAQGEGWLVFSPLPHRTMDASLPDCPNHYAGDDRYDVERPEAFGSEHDCREDGEHPHDGNDESEKERFLVCHVAHPATKFRGR
jgi:hypothetical protein